MRDEIGNGADGHVFVADMCRDFFRKAAVNVIFFEQKDIFGVCRQSKDLPDRERKYPNELEEGNLLVRKSDGFGSVFREPARCDDDGLRAVDIFGIGKEFFMRDHAVRA